MVLPAWHALPGALAVGGCGSWQLRLLAGGGLAIGVFWRLIIDHCLLLDQSAGGRGRGPHLTYESHFLAEFLLERSPADRGAIGSYCAEEYSRGIVSAQLR